MATKNVKFNQNDHDLIIKAKDGQEILNTLNSGNKNSKFENMSKEMEFPSKTIQSNNKPIKNKHDNINSSEFFASGEEKITVL